MTTNRKRTLSFVRFHLEARQRTRAIPTIQAAIAKRSHRTTGRPAAVVVEASRSLPARRRAAARNIAQHGPNPRRKKVQHRPRRLMTTTRVNHEYEHLSVLSSSNEKLSLDSRSLLIESQRRAKQVARKAMARTRRTTTWARRSLIMIRTTRVRIRIESCADVDSRSRRACAYVFVYSFFVSCCLVRLDVFV